MDDKTIRFIDSDYKELFRIPNGGSITVTYPPDDGREPATRACEFLDETHTKIGGNVYHIAEFAERMEAICARYEPEAQLRDAEIVPFSVGEENFFTYNREENNSCIGHIAGEFGSQGDRYFSNWSDRENGRNTPEFQTELHSAVYALRQGLLKDYGSMLAYCQSHPEAKLEGGDKFARYGFKLETDTREYFVSCLFGEQQRDARFVAYAYDKDAPVLEQSAPELVVEISVSEITSASPDESKLFYRNDEEGNLCVGYLRGDFGRQGNGFWHGWFDRDSDRNTPEFKAEFDHVMTMLRADILKDHKSSEAYCYHHPEAKLPGDREHYGFKVETEEHQYFIRCTPLIDDYFYIFAYDKAPVLEVAPKTTTYTLDELLKVMEPQAQRDKALISACIDGLGLYAAQQAQFNPQSSKTEELRGLADTLVGYWGLDEGANAKTAEDILSAFDDRVAAAKSGEKVTLDASGHQDSTIYGLYRYGMEMVVAQGDSAMGEILSVCGLIQEIGTAWDYEPYTVPDDLSARLTSEVRGLLDNVTLPGQPQSGEMVQRYEVMQAVLFDNDRGFALAQNPAAPSPFVTWQFTNNDGVRDYYWGRYCGTEERAKVDYLSRVSDYRETYHLPEKPIPTAAAEISREQNYNMIDGLHNNEPTPRADLTDGQTLEEIRELAPETLPDEKASVLDRIRDARENPQPHKEKDAHTHARDKEDLSL